MKKIDRRSFLKASGLLGAAAALTACGGSSSGTSGSASGAASKAAAGKNAAHAPLTIMDAQRDYTRLMELVNAQYPDVRLEVQAYRGNNTTAYMSKQLRTGILPDIYTTTHAGNVSAQEEYLLDLSQYSVSDQFNEVRMNDTDVDGANYLLPYDYTILTMSYNKSLFERQGWEVPTSFEELKALVPQIQAAGVDLSACQINMPGFGFQYFCNLSDTIFLSSVDGQQWQDDFLAGSATAAGTPQIQLCKEYFQQWIDLGILHGKNAGMASEECFSRFAEGNTAFYIGTLSRFTQNEDGTGDQYACLPYLSPNGVDNCYIFLTSRFYGLNKTLAEPGNEQKLEDALHFLEVLATRDGYDAVLSSSPTSLCSIKDFELEPSSPYYEVLDAINDGYSAPMLYTGWEDYIVPIGGTVIDWMQGKATGDDVLTVLDQTQEAVRKSDGSTLSYAAVTQRLDNEQTTRLIAMMMLDQTDADAALVSRNVWKAGVEANHENTLGVNGEMLPGILTEGDIVINLPMGWSAAIPAMTLTGARLKELAAYGFDYNHDGDPYPYLLLTRDNQELDDATVYTVVFCGATDEVQKEGHARDTGIVGLDAAKAYYQKLGTISPETVA